MTPEEVKIQKIQKFDHNEDWSDSDDNDNEKDKDKNKLNSARTVEDTSDDSQDSDGNDKNDPELISKIVKVNGKRVFFSKSQNIALSKKWIDVYVPLISAQVKA